MNYNNIEFASNPTSKSTYIYLIVGLFFATHILLPLDRGFPNFWIGPNMINTSIIISILTFISLFLFASDKAFLLNIFSRKYVRYQFIFIYFLLVGAVQSESTVTAFRMCLVYFSTFILNYISICYLCLKGYRIYLVQLIVSCSFIAGIIGVLEGIFYIRLTPYIEWANNVATSEIIVDELVFTRTSGTLGNPILYAVAMMLAVPFVLESRSVIRFIVIPVVVIAAFLTVSRTFLLMGIVLIVGAVINKILSLKYISIVALLFFIILSLINYSELSKDSRIDFWLQRIGLSSGLQAEGAVSGVDLRLLTIKNTLSKLNEDSILELIVGHGNLEDNKIGLSIDKSYNTIDNNYLSLAYNNGIVGLVLFVSIYMNILKRNSSSNIRNMYWFNIVSLLCCGFSFVFYFYSTFNILLVTSIVFIDLNE